MHSVFIFILITHLFLPNWTPAQKLDPSFPENFAYINFNDSLRPWDGFGVNYVETAQTTDYSTSPQDYGGFSTLSEEKRQEIIELIFGEEGLQPGIVKMFLDPFHEGGNENPNDNEDPFIINENGFDHESSTAWMRYFVKEGMKKSAQGNRDLSIITTLYGPPAWMTKQKAFRGRDLDQSFKYELAEYMVSWLKYLKENDFPVRYLSLHNEGEDYKRWAEDGHTDKLSHDYNLYWPPEQVVDFLEFMPDFMDKHGMTGIGLSPGETSTWLRLTINFRAPEPTSYATAIASNPAALDNIGLLTSHSFWNPGSEGTDFLKTRDFKWGDHQELKVWTTSLSWKKMGTDFISYIHDEIYKAKTNAIIPWACIQDHRQWIGGDPNPGSAFFVDGKGNYQITKGYYYYKQICRAGQPGMNVVQIFSSNPNIKIIAFDKGSNAKNRDVFVVINENGPDIPVTIQIRNADENFFSCFRTSPEEDFKDIGIIKIKENGTIYYPAKGNSVTTFFAGVQ